MTDFPGSPTTTLGLGGNFLGALDVAGEIDWFEITLQGGHSYDINLEGYAHGGAALGNPFLTLYDSSGVTVQSDDNSAAGANSFVFANIASGGTFYIAVSGAAASVGDYAVSVNDDTQVSDNDASTGEAIVGVPMTAYATLGNHYAVTLLAGHHYVISMLSNGEVAGPTAGMPDPMIILRNPSSLGGYEYQLNTLEITPTVSGTYDLLAMTYNGNPGYFDLTVSEAAVPTPPTSTPLSSINWTLYAAPTKINVFFAENGAHVNDAANGPFIAKGWDASEKAAAMNALANYQNVANVHFNVVSQISQADFVLAKNANTANTPIQGNLGYWDVGGYNADDTRGGVEYNGASYSVDGTGVFNSTDESWTHVGLAVGGYGYITLIHEIGHGMGLAHPHDNGGGSDIMHGVTSDTGDYGDYNLNQGVYTVMSYNDGWLLAPQVPERIPGASTYGFGWEGGLMALDIAELQLKYGANMSYHTGNDVYTLKDVNAVGTYYSSIWDAGGTDTIRYVGSKAATIDLRAATLNYSGSGGGLVSYVKGIYGGFTIANGVLIENATGGNGADRLIGNSSANTLDGWSGADTMTGYGGNDIYVVRDAADVVDESGPSANGIDTVRSFLSFSLAVGAHVMGNVENLSLLGVGNAVGNGLANVLIGSATANALSAGGGNDVLNGGLGLDSLAGGAGLDIFRFTTALGAANIDKITDFSHADDTIQLDDAVMAALGAVTGAIASALFVADAVGHLAANTVQRIIYDKHDGSLWYDANGSTGGAANAIEIAVLTTKPQNVDFHDFSIV